MKKAEFNIQGMVIGMLIAFGLFTTIIMYTIGVLDTNYDTTGYNSDDLEAYNKKDSLLSSINQSKVGVDDAVVDRNAFDYFADIISKITGPFKTIINTFGNFGSLTTSATSDLGLPAFWKDYIYAILTVLVFIGIVMIKFYFNRSK